MPFFSYPVDPNWLLTLVSGVLTVSSAFFRFLQAIHVVGSLALAAIVVGLFARNLMGPSRA
jgi:hypothetical protein